MFTTDAGVASLILEEIPYKRCAYIRLQDANDPEKLLLDAVCFCKTVGAETIYATGNDYLLSYPLHTEIWEMTLQRPEPFMAETTLIPVDETNIGDWQNLYNTYMANIPNAATMTSTGAQKLLQAKDGFFMSCSGVIIGIGKAKEDRVDVIVSLVPGKGDDVLHALFCALSGDRIKVEVASANRKAVKLYERNGFVKTSVLSKWYQVL